MNQEKITKFFNEGNYWEALDYLKENSKQEKHILSDWYLGNVYFKLHQYSKALEHILNFISVKKKDSLNLNFLGEIPQEPFARDGTRKREILGKLRYLWD